MAAFTATIASEGATVAPNFVLASIDIIHELNRIPRAELVYLDGSSADDRFAISGSGIFNPGKSITIHLRHEEEADTKFFSGIVVGQEVFADADGSQIRIEMKAPLFDLTTTRNSRVFADQTDAQVIKTILGDRAGRIDETDVTHSSMVQYQATDWDFILTRADACGLVVNVEDEKLDAFPPSVAITADHDFDFGSGKIFELELRADANHFLNSATAEGWDPVTQSIPQETAPAYGVPQGEKVMGDLPSSVKRAGILESLVAPAESELDVWATARISRNRLSMLRGRFSIDGKPDIKVNQTMEVSGISDVFDGLTLVTAVRHRVSEDGWVTDVQFGLSGEWLAEKPSVAAPAAAGLLPAVNGLQIGKVSGTVADESHPFCVQVRVPALKTPDQPEAPILWARVAMFAAGTGHGAWFLPRVDDEIVLGFFNDDPRNPVIVGSLYSSAQPPWVTAEKAQADSGYLTKGGFSIGFSDTDNEISLETPGGQMIQILEDSGITISSTKDVTVSGPDGDFIVAGKQIKIDGKNFQT